MKITELIGELNRRTSRAVMGSLGLRSEAATAFLRSQFEQEPGQKGSFFSWPVFEATFGWQQVDEEIGDLADDLFSPDVLISLDQPPQRPGEDLGVHAFPLDRKPYSHQVEAWRTLLDEQPKSALISCGTGSGKTECFLLPIIEDLYRENAKSNAPLEGVRALFLYPLNALINSQRERLKAWTAGFNGDIRFCLYNGETPENLPVRQTIDSPEEVMERKTLRASPPPILVTNSTMLEYMLVRNIDAPIVNKSKGKLRWIVLDEAHTYIGSQAAELALLLRRVLVAFDVEPDQVRFVATSATIGSDDPEGERKLRQFLADVGGIEPEQVSVIRGSRYVPPLPHRNPDESYQIEQICQLEEIDRAKKLAQCDPARVVREALTEAPHAKSTIELMEAVKPYWPDVTPKRLWRLMDCMAGNDSEISFLPFRAHIFQKTLAGIYSCIDSNCECRSDQLRNGNWPYGQIYLSERDYCPCGSPVQLLLTCGQCGQEYLDANLKFSADERAYFIEHAKNFDDDDGYLWELDNATETESEERLDARGDDEHVILSREVNDSATHNHLRRNSRKIVEGESEVQIYSTPASDFSCLICGSKDRANYQVFRPKRFGAVFFLGDSLPTLLEHSPPQNDDGPFGGRRMLTFTDSRQGTARLSARLQQDVDRNKVRSVIYHELSTKTSQIANPSLITSLEADIETLNQVLESCEPGEKQFIETFRNKKITQRDLEISNVVRPHLTWAEAESALRSSDDVSRRMYRANGWSFKANVQENDMPNFCLHREFMRRPTKGYQLETLGMVELFYPNIEIIQEVPDSWRILYEQISVDEVEMLADWKDWLTIIVDMHLRGNTAVNFPGDWINAMGAKVPPKKISPPGDTHVKGRVTWPSVNIASPSRPVGLLKRGFHMNLSDAEHRDIIEAVLRESWSCLRGAVLQALDDGLYSLNLRANAAFRPVTTAFRCPYSHKVVTRLFRNQSPNTAGNVTEPLVVELISIPSLPKNLAHQVNEGGRTRILDWLEGHEVLSDLRAKGLWPNRADRIALGEPWFRIEEHSAQIQSDQLKKWESLFKEGQLNVLSCSTTMEMGVDIGGMSTVAMNNVPPHPANYLQRSGRAGRRGETVAASYTLCNANANSMQVFTNPKWPFEPGQIAAPRVSLESRNIVQRHINSFLLAHWLHQLPNDFVKLKTGWFMEQEVGETLSRAERFLSWCDLISQDEEFDQLALGASRIAHGTQLQAYGLKRLASNAMELLEIIHEDWSYRLDALLEEKDAIIGGRTQEQAEKEPAFKAIEKTLERHRDEYLLKDLIHGGFLPGYGFPTDVISLNSLTIAGLKQQANHREDNLFSLSSGASRTTAVALREYAPGAETVINGLVYRSAGVTLNWHVPADVDAVQEIQNFFWLWRCRQCGEFGHQALLPRRCPSCGEASRFIIEQALEPAGFAVDLFVDPHNDVSKPTFLPFEDPLVAAAGINWIRLPNPDLGGVRYADQGLVSYTSRGVHGHGYTLCLACGRSEPQTSTNTPVDSVANEHRRLRGGRGPNGNTRCSGPNQPYLIKQDLILASNTRTSVFELQLRDPRVQFEGVRDKAIAWTVGYALRNALCGYLGISEREVEVAVKDERFDEGHSGLVLCLLDTASQGAGFVERLQEGLIELMREARDRLSCPSDCDSVCQHCLLDSQTQFREENLNRHIAIDWLDAWLEVVDLPEKFQFFGDESIPSYSSLQYQLAIVARVEQVTKVQFFVQGSAADTGVITDWPMLEFSQSLIRSGIQVEWVVLAGQVEELVETFGSVLSSLTRLHNNQLKICVIDQPVVLPKDGRLLMCVYSKESSPRRWAAFEPELGMNNGWGESQQPVVTTASGSEGLAADLNFLTELPQLPGERLTIPIRAGSVSKEITTELDCMSWRFGMEFITYTQTAFPAFGEILADENCMISEVTYSDRYLRSPLTTHLLYQLVRTLIRDRGKNIPITVSFDREFDDNRPPNWPNQNFKNSQSCKQVLRDLFGRLSSQVSVQPLTRQEMPHQRRLTIRFENGLSFLVEFDQGMGSWKGHTKVRVPHADADIERYIADMKVPIKIYEYGTTINYRKE